MQSTLEQLKQMTTVVADTGDVEAIRRFSPEDATTNPSLILRAVTLDHYQPLLQTIVTDAVESHGDNRAALAAATDNLLVAMGGEILRRVPGRVSTEVDARLSFDTEATLAKARRLIGLYEKAGFNRSRILIKVAATWEGIRAAEQLEREGINCNLTLLFSFAQARACAEAGVYLISPFVGRILDWHLHNGTQASFEPAGEPGVESVRQIYQYYKTHGYDTVVMGASFRNAGEIIALAGCDRLTISPALLEELSRQQQPLTRALEARADHTLAPPEPLSESEFRLQHNDDAMATEKLAEGIRQFVTDQEALERQLLQAIAQLRTAVA